MVTKNFSVLDVSQLNVGSSIHDNLVMLKALTDGKDYWFKIKVKIRIDLDLSLEGKSMVRWFTFDILKIPHLTLASIIAVKIIIKL